MHSLILQPAAGRTPADPAAEAARLEALLAERRAELAALQEELREFKARYARAVGGRVSELAEIERAIRAAESRLLGVEPEEEEGEGAGFYEAQAEDVQVRKALRRLFWSVAKVFHPDHASDEREARRRHSVMAEASRAYREGDVESLHTLLGDDALQSYCAAGHARDEEEDLQARVVRLELELRTVEFGIKRARQDALYKLKLQTEEEAAQGRDPLAATAERLDRRIVKARRRLEHLS